MNENSTAARASPAGSGTQEEETGMVLCRDRAFYRQTLRLGGFIALQNVVVCFVGLADNVMIGA